MINFNLKNNKVSPSFNDGFTLVEAMFAVFILTFSITVLMTVVSNSIFQSKYAKNEITATYLAQEVIDYIRNTRDSEVLNGGIFSNFINKYNACSSYGCYIDVPSGGIEVCLYNGCPNLYYNENGSLSFYYHNYNGVLSNFNRKVIVTQSGDEVKIKVIVSWKNGMSDKSIELESSLLDW